MIDERPKTFLKKYPDSSHQFDSTIVKTLDKTKTLTMARSQATKKMTRKGSKQLTDDERESLVASPTRVASQTRVASPTIPPDKIDGTIQRDPATLAAIERKSQAFWTPEILQGVRDAQKKCAKMTKKERAIAYEKTRLSLGMLPIETVREMREDDRNRAERAKQRGNTKRPYGNVLLSR